MKYKQRYDRRILILDAKWQSPEDAEEFLQSEEFHRYLIKEYKLNPPALVGVYIKKKGMLYTTLEFTKQGLPMDWAFYSGQRKITKAAILDEHNVEKRRLLMMEYGVSKFFSDIKVIDESAYGTLIEVDLEGEPHKFVKEINGTSEAEAWQQNPSLFPSQAAFDKHVKDLKIRGMITESGHKLYYEPVPDEMKTAREAQAWMWDVDVAKLPKKGWDWEA
jgi:hypothetical protein